MTPEGAADLDFTLAKLDDCDLAEWDRDFVDDMIRRLDLYGEDIFVSGKQWAQIERMKEHYL